MRGLRGNNRVSAVTLLAAAAVVCAAPAGVRADSFSSSNYKIDSSVGNSFGGSTSSTSYKLVQSGGEAVIGDGSSGSYRLGAGYVSQLNQSIQLAVQPASLLVHYPMDETAGTRLYDNSTGSADAALTGAPSRTTGKLGQALSLNGSSQYGSAGRQTGLDVGVGVARTFSAWFKASTQSQRAYIVDQYGTCTGWALSLETSGAVRLVYSADNSSCATPSTYTATSSTTGYDDNAWHHVIGVVDRPSGQIKVYVDGQPKATTSSVNNTSASADGNLVIGADGSFAGKFTGLIDDVKAFDHAFTDKEAEHEYTALNSGVATSLTFAAIIPNQSQTVTAKAIVQTDAPGYSLALAQDQNLTSGANSIGAVSGSIASPALWSEGTTKGLGFTLTSGPSLPGTWGSNPNYKYAAVPGTSTTMYTRSGYTGGAKDVITSQYRVDVTTSQVAGDYKNTVTYTATVLP